jgi:hypothetical protein
VCIRKSSAAKSHNAAVDLFNKSNDFRKMVDPRTPVGESNTGGPIADTDTHAYSEGVLGARLELRRLLRDGNNSLAALLQEMLLHCAEIEQRKRSVRSSISLDGTVFEGRTQSHVLELETTTARMAELHA